VFSVAGAALSGSECVVKGFWLWLCYAVAPEVNGFGFLFLFLRLRSLPLSEAKGSSVFQRF
jgi:hypothetical protein